MSGAPHDGEQQMVPRHGEALGETLALAVIDGETEGVSEVLAALDAETDGVGVDESTEHGASPTSSTEGKRRAFCQLRGRRGGAGEAGDRGR